MEQDEVRKNLDVDLTMIAQLSCQIENPLAKARGFLCFWFILFLSKLEVALTNYEKESIVVIKNQKTIKDDQK